MVLGGLPTRGGGLRMAAMETRQGAQPPADGPVGSVDRIEDRRTPTRLERIECEGCGRWFTTPDGPAMLVSIKGACPECGGSFRLADPGRRADDGAGSAMTPDRGSSARTAEEAGLAVSGGHPRRAEMSGGDAGRSAAAGKATAARGEDGAGTALRRAARAAAAAARDLGGARSVTRRRTAGRR